MVCGRELKTFGSRIALDRPDHDGIMLPRLSRPGMVGFIDIAALLCLASGPAKKDGLPNVSGAPVVFEPIAVLICCADAGSVSANNKSVPSNSLRTLHLPHFENRAIQPYKKAGR